MVSCEDCCQMCVPRGDTYVYLGEHEAAAPTLVAAVRCAAGCAEICPCCTGVGCSRRLAVHIMRAVHIMSSLGIWRRRAAVCGGMFRNRTEVGVATFRVRYTYSSVIADTIEAPGVAFLLERWLFCVALASHPAVGWGCHERGRLPRQSYRKIYALG